MSGEGEPGVPLGSLSVEEVAMLLGGFGLADVQPFRDADIGGLDLAKLTGTELESHGVDDPLQRADLLERLAALKAEGVPPALITPAHIAARRLPPPRRRAARARSPSGQADDGAAAAMLLVDPTDGGPSETAMRTTAWAQLVELIEACAAPAPADAPAAADDDEPEPASAAERAASVAERAIRVARERANGTARAQAEGLAAGVLPAAVGAMRARADHAAIQRQACWLVGNMCAGADASARAAKQAAADAGAVRAAVAALRGHGEDAGVVRCASFALSALCGGGDDDAAVAARRRTARDAGARAAVERSLLVHPHHTLVRVNSRALLSALKAG